MRALTVTLLVLSAVQARTVLDYKTVPFSGVRICQVILQVNCWVNKNNQFLANPISRKYWWSIMGKAWWWVYLACLGQRIGQLTAYCKCQKDQQRRARLQPQDCQEKSRLGMDYKIFDAMLWVPLSSPEQICHKASTSTAMDLGVSPCTLWGTLLQHRHPAQHINFPEPRSVYFVS